MTFLYLLFCIFGAVLLQLLIFFVISFVRYRQQYRALYNTPVEGATLVESSASVAWVGFRNFRVQRKEAEDAAGQICSFYLVPQDAAPLPAFLPGQFLTFRLDIPSQQGGAEALMRCYTLSDAPNPNAYRVSIKRAHTPAGTAHAQGHASNYFHDHVVVGSVVQVRAPAGHFYLDRSEAPVVLIAGGIGITPMLSMVNWCLAEQVGREVWLFYGVRNGAELIMQSHLLALAAVHPQLHLHFCFSDPQPGDLLAPAARAAHCHAGRVNMALMRKLLPLKSYHFYMCGPTPMLASLVPALEDWGVPDARIHFEAFGPASIQRKTVTSAQPDTRAALMVNFAKSGKQFAWQPGMGSLLDFAEAHGVSVASGCRAGVCGSCQTTIRTGAVAYAQPLDWSPDPGTCLLCVSTPQTAVTLEA